MNANLKNVARCSDASGLETREESEACVPTETPGIELDGTRMRARCTSSRFRRVCKTLEWVLGRRRISGKALEIIIGHCTCVSLLNRYSLSMFDAVCKFIRCHYNSNSYIWKSVREELLSSKSIMILLESDWKLSWNSTLVCTDACSSGYGVVLSQASPDLISKVGRVKVRARFKSTTITRACERALSKPWSPSEELECPFEELIEVDEDSPEVPSHILTGNVWEVVDVAAFERQDKIHALEARAVVPGVIKMIDRGDWKQCRALLLSDNVATVLSMCCSRARDYKLLLQVRRLCSLCCVLASS